MPNKQPESQSEVERQPDAWKITDADGGYWFTDKPENPDLFISEIMQTPLYATLPRDPQGLVEALEWVANNSDYGSTHKIVAEAALAKAKDRTNG